MPKQQPQNSLPPGTYCDKHLILTNTELEGHLHSNRHLTPKSKSSGEKVSTAIFSLPCRGLNVNKQPGTGGIFYLKDYTLSGKANKCISRFL